MKAIILAAGLGIRLRPLTDNLPKPMLPINNKPLIYHQIAWLKKSGINDIAVNLHHLPEKIKDYLGNGEKFDVKITYSYEKEILGTAGGVKRLGNFIGNEAFLVYYGDNLTDLNIRKFIEFHNKKKGIATICLHRIKEDELKDSSIVRLSESNRIISFEEKPDQKAVKGLIPDKNNFSNAGIYMLKPSVLESIEKGSFSDFAKDIFPMLIGEGKELYGYPLKDCFWAEIGNLKKYEKIKKEAEGSHIFSH